jgi:hypothetical protein
MVINRVLSFIVWVCGCWMCTVLRAGTIWTLNELAVGQSPGGRNVSTEADNIVEIRHQATTGEDTTD